MSTIPPNWMASILGTHDTKKAASDAKRRENADQSDRTNAPGFADSLKNVIEDSDRDTEVYADGEGLGSQGRAPSELPEEPELEHDEENESTPPTGGIDVQA